MRTLDTLIVALARAAKQAHSMTVEQIDSLFAKHPDYASTKVRIFERDRELKDKTPQEANNPGAEKRLSFLIAQFDIFAEEYLRLVVGLDSQRAFQALLQHMTRTTWQFYTGYRFEDAPPSLFPDKWAQLSMRAEYWTAEGYRKIVPATLSAEPNSPDMKSGKPKPRDGGNERNRRERLLADSCLSGCFSKPLAVV